MQHIFDLEIITEEDDDLDSEDYTGLSRDAYDRLYIAIRDAGFVMTEVARQETN